MFLPTIRKCRSTNGVKGSKNRKQVSVTRHLFTNQDCSCFFDTSVIMARKLNLRIWQATSGWRNTVGTHRGPEPRFRYPTSDQSQGRRGRCGGFNWMSEGPWEFSNVAPLKWNMTGLEMCLSNVFWGGKRDTRAGLTYTSVQHTHTCTVVWTLWRSGTGMSGSAGMTLNLEALARLRLNAGLNYASLLASWRSACSRYSSVLWEIVCICLTCSCAY